MRGRRPLIITVALLMSVYFLAPAVVEFAARHYLRNLQETLETQGVKLAITGIVGQRLGITASSVDLWIPVKVGGRGVRLPLTLELRDVTMSLHIIPSPHISFRGSAYEGTFDGSLHELRDPRGPTLRLDLTRVDLGAHPQLSALGLSKALTTVSVDQARMDLTQVTSGQFDLGVTDATFLISPKLAEIIGGEFQQISSLLKIEEVRDANLTMRAKLEDGAFSVRPITFASSLGSISGQARGILDTGRTEPSFTTTLRIELSDTTRNLQNWLPLLSQNTLSSETTRFTTNISSTPCSNTSVPTLRLGRLCLRSSLAP
jgi:hypothetical protein